jgi:hypothetical protein
MAFLCCRGINTLLFRAVVKQLKAAWHILVCIKMNVLGFARFLTPVCLNIKSSRGYEVLQKKRVHRDFHKKLSQFPNGSKSAIILQRSLFVSLLDFWDGNAEGTVVFTELIWNCKARSLARQANYEFWIWISCKYINYLSLETHLFVAYLTARSVCRLCSVEFVDV